MQEKFLTKLALKEYEKYKPIQNQEYLNDFDKYLISEKELKDKIIEKTQ